MTLETGVKELAEAVGADVKALDAGKVNSNDPRLTDAREWSEATVPQAEAEAGTASTRRAWTSQRVRQAINAWWQLVTSGFGRNFIAASNEQAARNVLQLGTAATRDVGTNSGQLLAVGSNGYGISVSISISDWNEATINGVYYQSRNGLNAPINGWLLGRCHAHSVLHCTQTVETFNQGGYPRTFKRQKAEGIWQPWQELITTGNILTTTGQSTSYPMTQKAVTDAINARGFADASGILTVTSGALSNDMSSFLSQTTKATMRSNLEVPQLNASATQQGGLKARLDGTTLYLTNNGTNP